MLDIDRLEELEESIRKTLDEDLLTILTRLNRTDRLNDFLDMLGMADLLDERQEYSCVKNGKIVILGQCEVPTHMLEGIAKNLGISKRRFEYYPEYEDAKSFDPRHIYWRLDTYSLVIAGPMPHKGQGIGDNGSVLSMMMNNEGYPPVIRAGSGGLKAISKSSFRSALEEAIQKKWIEAA